MLSFLSALPVVGTIIQSLGNLGVKLYDAKLQAAGSHEAKVAELAKREMDSDDREAALNQQEKANILGRWYAPENLFVYFIAFPYWFKAVTVDNVLGSIWDLGLSTPALGGDTAKIMMMIMVFWFGKRSLTSVASIIAGAFKRS